MKQQIWVLLITLESLKQEPGVIVLVFVMEITGDKLEVDLKCNSKKLNNINKKMEKNVDNSIIFKNALELVL